MKTKQISKKTLGSRIKFARNFAEITQQDLASNLSTTHSQIHNYETDKSMPPSDKLLKISQLCKIDPGWLLSGEGNPF